MSRSFDKSHSTWKINDLSDHSVGCKTLSIISYQLTKKDGVRFRQESHTTSFSFVMSLLG